MVGESGQLEVGYTFHKDTDTNAVSLLSDRNEYNSQYTYHRPRQLLATVWQHMSLIMLPTGSTGPVVHLCSLTGS